MCLSFISPKECKRHKSENSSVLFTAIFRFLQLCWPQADIQ